jgi:hypothetical protein
LGIWALPLALAAAWRGHGSGLCGDYYDEPVTTSSVRPVVLRNGVDIEDPLSVVLDLLRAYGRLGISSLAQPVAFGEPDLRLANRGGARISAAEIAAILERRGAIEGALRAIAPDVSLAGAADSVPWLVLRQLFDAFADIRGVGFAKMTKALHPKRPALIPMLDSIVQKYLQDDDLGAHAPFAERALGLVHGYKRDLDRNWAALRAVREELAGSGYGLTEVRILDLLILSASAQTTTRPAGGLVQLGLQGGRVGADPFLGEQAVGDPVELVADVLDGAAGGGHTQELPLVGAAEGQPEGHLVARGDDVVDVRVQIGKATLDDLNPLPPHLRAMPGGQAGHVHHEVRAEEGDAGVDVALVECVEAVAHERNVGGGGLLRGPGAGLHGARCWANQSRAGMLAASKPLTYASK